MTTEFNNDTPRTRFTRRDDGAFNTPHVSGDTQKPKRNLDGSTTNWHTTDTTVTQYGLELAVTKYDYPVSIYKGRKTKPSYNNKNEKLQKNLKRAQQKIRRLAMQNYPLKKEKYNSPCFLTLTYKDPERAHPRNRHLHLLDLAQFFRSLREIYGSQIKYIFVPEIQPKRKELRNETCVHWHALLFNLPYNEYEKVFSCWKYGEPQSQEMTRLKTGYSASRTHCDKIAGYITKFARYMTKENADKLVGYYEKTYLPSKGLLKPVTTTDPRMVQLTLDEAILGGYRPSYTSPPFYCRHYCAWATYEVWLPFDT